MVNATLLETAEDVDSAIPGLYVVQSGTDAYFPALALVEDNFATILGEVYDEGSKIVTLQVFPSPEAVGNSQLFGDGDEPERRVITIGREFFITALKDYEDWQVKWWREVVQNSVDAGANYIMLGVRQLDDDNMQIYAEDNGSGMDEDTVINKFLVLGGTTKTSTSGTAGGFGKAKELLLLPWISWRIHTRDVLIEGAGIDYTVHRSRYLQGTRIEVVMPPDQTTTVAAALSFLEKCYLPNTTFTINGEPALADLVGHTLVTEVPDKANIYFTPAAIKQSYMYVRTHGIFMFRRYIGEVPGYVIADLTAPSIEILTANRDGFRDAYVARTIDRLAEKIAKDNLSALRSEQGYIRQKFEGSGKFRARRLAADLFDQIGPSQSKLADNDINVVVSALRIFAEQDEHELRTTQLPSSTTAKLMLEQRYNGPNHIEAALKQLVWEPDFFIVNEMEGWRVPRKFFPDSMTPTILKLAKTWVELCRYVFMQLGSDTQFGVGFIFSPHTAAAAITEGDPAGTDVSEWLMLNPYKEMYEGPIWRPTQSADLKWLYAAAIHEATHIADGLSYHDESFASALTLNMSKCADGFRKIKKIVGSIKMRGGVKADVPTIENFYGYEDA
jgi:hypothetical protein